MKTLPVIPVETLASIRAAAPAPDRNPGIVPPWLQHAGRNPGIVPPWLQVPTPVQPDEPVADDVPRILGAADPTAFDPQPAQY